jgi:hypothetical protein
MLLRLFRECAAEIRLERFSSAQWRAQIDLVIAEKARTQPAVCREAHAIA